MIHFRPVYFGFDHGLHFFDLFIRNSVEIYQFQ